MKDIQVYNSPEFGSVRTVTIDGEPWFVASDVCKALEIKNGRDAVGRLDDDEKGVALTDTLGGKQHVTTVNEPGLYNLILGSRKPEAKAFKRWITHEVIPSIRKNGGYIAGQETLSDEELLSRALLVAQNKIEERTAQLAAANQTITEQKGLIEAMAPKAAYYDVILQCADLTPISVIAKDYGMSGKAFNQMLADLRIQYKPRGSSMWLLYIQYASEGYTGTKTTAIPRSDGSITNKTSTQWTQKGRQFLYDKLKENGVIPVMERRKEVAV